MVKQYHILLSLVAAFVMLGGRAEAFVVQNPQQAFSFRNVARETGMSPPAENEKLAFVSDSRIDYEEIADKLLGNAEPEKIFIDLYKDTGKNISASPGQTFFVVLPEAEGSSWHLDSQTRLVEIVSSEHTGRKRILELRVLCCGDDTIYLDNLMPPLSNPRVVQSRILRLRVNKK